MTSSTSRSIVALDVARMPAPVSFMPQRSHRGPRGNGLSDPPDALKNALKRQGAIRYPTPGSATIRPSSVPVRIGRLELAPDLADVDVDVVRLVAVRGAPDRAQQAAVGDQAAGVRDQDLEHLVLARREVDGSIAAP